MNLMKTNRSGAMVVAALLAGFLFLTSNVVAAQVSELTTRERVLVDVGVLPKRQVDKFQRFKSELSEFSLNNYWGERRDAAGKAFFALCVAVEQKEGVADATRRLWALGDET